MMAVWQTDIESSPSPAVVSLPTPADTPYRTPSRSSRKSRRSATPPGKPGKSSSPPPAGLADKGDRGSKRSSRDVSQDESISVLDPRRFTPTLHASLVSEILALRRDQEEKTKIIESLESTLHTTREEAESAKANMLSTAKESRSLKRQLALLEGGTSSALGELARERDEAVETAADTKKRLESTQKRLRGLEEDSERVHDQWAKEKDEWEEEKRKYERKIHVAESRLKVVLEEVAAYQEGQADGALEGPESEVDENVKEDGASIRTMSMTNSIRFSVMNGVKPTGNSLADELNFGSDYDDETDHGGRDSVLSNQPNNKHMRNMSRDSMFSRTHRRNQSNDSLMRPGSVARGRLAMNQMALDRLEDGIIKEDDENLPTPTTTPAKPKAEYVDTGIQYSPPPSPKLKPAKPLTTDVSAIAARFERAHEVEIPPRMDLEIEANQRRKRVHIGQPPLTIKPPQQPTLMVNGSSQTAEEPLSPPKTPKSPFQETPVTPKALPPPVVMVTASTQTDDLPPPLRKAPSLEIPRIMQIPSISIIPPTSRPTTPGDVRLPQQFKDIGVQVSILTGVRMTSAAVQTEEIRIDKRLDKLPVHLHPSSITSRPTSPAAPKAELATDVPLPSVGPGVLPPRNPRRLTSKKSLSDMPSSPPPVSAILEEETHDAYPGNNDDGPLSGEKAPMRRPHRISSLFAGFDGNSSDEVDEFVDGEVSDSEYRTALSAPRPKSALRAAKRSSTASPTSPDLIGSSGARSSTRPLGSTEIYSSYNLADRESRESAVSTAVSKAAESKRASRSAMLSSSNKSGVMRKAAMIQNGIATHSRARSPSLPDIREPPFPIPTRASSRRPPLTASAPSDGRASPTKDSSWGRRPSSRKHYRANSIRKVRSAAAIQRSNRNRRTGSRSPPPPFSPSTEAPSSPGLPPLPHNDITMSRNRDSYGNGRFKASSHQSQMSTDTTGVQSVGSSTQQTGVVDAIAQTMVGEWMFKYVRRRKSFGVADAKGGDENSNDRHKRWVWLAPYERSILWSSKQPSSGSALMGKPGRKLTIQSVLDVKDDNAPPKGSGPLFNRSILILTPQRALKFTATNAERHYIWLTSLSFLAHSQQAVPEILAPQQQLLHQPPKPTPEQFEIPKPKGRKPIRDSIRLTKAKTAITTNGTALPSIPSTNTAINNNNNTNGRPGAISVASSHTDTFSVPPSIPSIPSYSTNRPSQNQSGEVYHLPAHARDMSRDAAEPPFIPRFHLDQPGPLISPHYPPSGYSGHRVQAIHERANQVTLHGRKRSNTGGHVPPPLSFRGFSGPIGGGHAATNSTAGNSIGTAGSSDIYNNSVSAQSQSQSQSQYSGSAMTWATGSVRTSEASSRPSGAVMNNFFDAIGTVRMEAFISPLAFNQIDEGSGRGGGHGGVMSAYEDEGQRYQYVARRRSKELRRRQSRSRNRDSYMSKTTATTNRTTDDVVEEWYLRDDPFKGF